MKKRLYLFVFALLLSFFACEKTTIVARVGNYVVKLQDVRNSIKDRVRGEEVDTEIALQQVNRLVDNKLMLIAALKAGLEQDSTVQEYVARVQENAVYRHVIQEEVVDRVITWPMLKKRYTRKGKQWHVRHIFIPLKKKSDAKRNEIVSQLQSVRSRILRGEDFAQLARSTSKDSLSAGKGGDLGFLKWGDKDYGDEFYNAIEKLAPGQVSRVIESDVGFHLVKVEKIRNLDQRPLKEAKDQIQRTFFREKKHQLDSTYYDYIDRLAEKYNARYYDSTFDSLRKILVEKARDKIRPQVDPDAFLKSLTEVQRAMVLAEFDGGTFTVDRMFKIYRTIPGMRRPALSSRDAISDFVHRNLPRTIVMFDGMKRGVHKTPQVRKTVEEEKEAMLIRRARQVFIEDKVSVTDEEMKKYYDENAYKYEKDVKVNVLQIRVTDADTAAAIADQAKKGARFLELAKRYNEPTDEKVSKIKLGYITSRDYGILSRKAVQMRTGEISDPINYNGKYSIIKVIDRIAGEPTPFAKVKPRIKRELQRMKRNERQQSWMDELRTSISVHIFENVIKREFGKSNV